MDYKNAISTLAADTFAAILKAEKDYKEAKAALEAPASDKLEGQRRQLAFDEAKDALNKIRRDTAPKAVEAMDRLRENYAAESKKKYDAAPADIDNNVLELLKSKILRPREYHELILDAIKTENFTMIRLIGKYAMEAAEAAKNADTARELRILANAANQDFSANALYNFDVVADAFSRCCNNPAMISRWDQLTGDALNAL